MCTPVTKVHSQIKCMTANVSTLKLPAPMDLTFGGDVWFWRLFVFQAVMCDGDQMAGYLLRSFLVTVDCEDSVSTLFSSCAHCSSTHPR